MPCCEKDATLAQKLGQLQPFVAVFPQECTGQLASLGQPNTFLAFVITIVVRCSGEELPLVMTTVMRCSDGYPARRQPRHRAALHGLCHRALRLPHHLCHLDGRGRRRVRSHCRSRNRATESLSECGIKWLNGRPKRQCNRTPGWWPPPPVRRARRWYLARLRHRRRARGHSHPRALAAVAPCRPPPRALAAAGADGVTSTAHGLHGATED